MKRLAAVLIGMPFLVPAATSIPASRPFACLPPATTEAHGAALLSRVPAVFVENQGQWTHAARYVWRSGPMSVFLERAGWVFTLMERSAKSKGTRPGEEPTTVEPPAGREWGVAVRMRFAAACADAELVPEERAQGVHNYFLGDDPARWRTDVPLHASVLYRGLYPGVDLRVREQEGHFEYDLLLQPGAQLEPVETAVEGIERMQLDADGALILDTRLGPVRMPAPLCWQKGPSGESSLVTCRYVLRGEDRFGFEVSGRRPGWTLIVDPGLVWSTFLGPSDMATAVDLDVQGAATVAGYTFSSAFPTTLGAFSTAPNGSQDAFVTRLSPNGASLVWSTFLGARYSDQINALAVDAQGATTVAGWTQSPNFPTTPGAFDTSFNGGYADAFVTRLSPTGASLVMSTFLGGKGDIDDVLALALDQQGAATVAGTTDSMDFPTTPGALDTTYNGGNRDAFVTRLSPTGARLVWSTFLGGAEWDHAQALGLDELGTAIVAGTTRSTDFPTTPWAVDTTLNGGLDAFVTRLSPTGAGLVYSTFLGGTADDASSAVACDAGGTATVVGWTRSPDFPTTAGTFDGTYNGNQDAFVTRLLPTGTSLAWSTFLGGTGLDLASALDLDGRGAATLAGTTASADFPTTPGAFDRIYNGGNTDAFVTRLWPMGESLVYSTLLGGTRGDHATALALDGHGAATVAGMTESTDFPTTPGAFDTSANGRDAFITRLDMLPTGASRYGASSPGCAGPLAISVTSMPRSGNATFALTCTSAPPYAAGLLPLALGGLPSPVRVLGIDLWLDPRALSLVASAASDFRGAALFPLPLPRDAKVVGLKLHAQFVWLGPTAPPPCPPLGLSASAALEVTIQP